MTSARDKYEAPENLSPCFYSLDFYQKRKKGKYRLSFAPAFVGPVADTHCHIGHLPTRPFWPFVRCAMHGVRFMCCMTDSIDDGPDTIDQLQVAYDKARDMIPGIKHQILENDGFAVAPVTINEPDKVQLCLDTESLDPHAKMPEYRIICGAHPHYAKDFDYKAESTLRSMLKNEKVCAVGEIGLDFHYDISPRDAQIDAFKRQLLIAQEFNLPVSLHLREAHDVALDVFKEVGFGSAGTLVHCFNLDKDALRPWVDAGCYIAIGGPVTFKKSDDLREAVKFIPKDRLLTETDAPYMTPEPVRGDTCFPDHVIYTAHKLCEIVNPENEEAFYEQLMNNARELLDRPNPNVK